MNTPSNLQISPFWPGGFKHYTNFLGEGGGCLVSEALVALVALEAFFQTTSDQV